MALAICILVTITLKPAMTEFHNLLSSYQPPGVMTEHLSAVKGLDNVQLKQYHSDGDKAFDQLLKQQAIVENTSVGLLNSPVRRINTVASGQLFPQGGKIFPISVDSLSDISAETTNSDSALTTAETGYTGTDLILQMENPVGADAIEISNVDTLQRVEGINHTLISAAESIEPLQLVSDQPVLVSSDYVLNSNNTSQGNVAVNINSQVASRLSPLHKLSIQAQYEQNTNVTKDGQLVSDELQKLQESNTDAIKTKFTDPVSANLSSENQIIFNEKLLRGFGNFSRLDQVSRQSHDNRVSLSALSDTNDSAILNTFNQSGIAGDSRVSNNLTLTLPVQNSAWSTEFGERVRWLVTTSTKQAEITLTPRNMGAIEVSISLENDQTNIQINTQNPAARDLVESSIGRLREILDQSGMGQVDVGVNLSHSSDNQQQSNQNNNVTNHDKFTDKDVTATFHQGYTYSDPSRLVDLYA